MNIRSTIAASTLALGVAVGGFASFGAGSAQAATPIQIQPCALTVQGCGPVVSLVPGITIPPITIPKIPVIPINPCVLNPSAPGCGPVIKIPPKIDPCILVPGKCKPDTTTPPKGHDDPEVEDEPQPHDEPADADTPVKAKPTFTG